MEIYIVIVIVCLLVLYMFSYFVPLRIYIEALFSGVNVQIGELIAMRIRKVPPKIIMDALIKSHKGKLHIGRQELEAHYLAGGNVGEVVQAMITAKAAGINISFQHTAQADLSGVDVVAKVRQEITDIGIGDITD